MVKNSKCTCNWGWSILAWILFAVALWALVAGFATQFNSINPAAVDVNVLAWYFGGALVFTLAKIAKWKGHGNCTVHGMK